MPVEYKPYIFFDPHIKITRLTVVTPLAEEISFPLVGAEEDPWNGE
jgi:hypothetical protein